MLLIMPFIAPSAHPPVTHHASPVTLKSRVVSASVLKQGLALVVREVQVPGTGTYKLDALPDALDGSFWYGSPDGLVVNDVETKLRFEDSKPNDAKNMQEIFAANVGKRMHFYVTTTTYGREAHEVTKEVYATLVDGSPRPNGYASSLTFRLDNGDLYVPTGTITRLDTKGLKTKFTRKIATQEIDFQVDAAHPGRVDFANLENTAAWTGSYLITLSSDTNANVVSKAQLAVGGLKLQDTDVQVVSGSPALPDIVKFDLASGFGSLNAYLKNSQENYRRYRMVNRDPYTLIPTFFGQGGYNQGVTIDGMPISIYADSYGGGGMGGFGGNSEINSIDEPTYNNQPKQQTNTEKVEDLYGFPLGHVDMEPGDRLSRVMFRVESTYQRLYRWLITHDQPNPYQLGTQTDRVEKLLKVKNDSSQPWPGGSAMIVSKNVPLGEVDMKFTPVGKSAELTLGLVNDIPVRKSVKELSRKGVVVRGINLTEVTSEATLTVENTRKEDLPFEISFQVSGQVQEPGGAELEQLGIALNFYNPETVMTWDFTLKPGESKQVTVRYTTNV